MEKLLLILIVLLAISGVLLVYTIIASRRGYHKTRLITFDNEDITKKSPSEDSAEKNPISSYHMDRVPLKLENMNTVLGKKGLSTVPEVAKQKKRVLIIQDGAYVKFPESAKYSKAINKAYCDKWHYEYKFLEHSVSELPPYWLKVIDVSNELRTGLYDIVMYMDLDACFMQFDISLEMLLQNVEEKAGFVPDIYIGEDCDPEKNANTGVFLVRNTVFSMNFMHMWKSACISGNGKRVNSCAAWAQGTNGKWQCPHCEWAGKQYEQGSFDQLAALYSSNVAILHRSFFSTYNENEPCFVLHLMASAESKRLKVLSDMYVKLKKNGHSVRLEE